MNHSPPWNGDDLGKIVNFKTGKLNSNAAVVDGRYPFFTCSQETLRTNTFSFDTECVLLAGNNANGIFPLKYFCGQFDAYQRTYIITPKDRRALDTRFLYYALRPQLDHLRSISTGAATKFLTLTILNGLRLAFPRVETQRKIATILSSCDDLIENNTRRIAVLEEMTQSLYSEWFIRFRFPGHEQVSLADSQLGKIPRGWQIVRLGSLCESIASGGTPRTSTEEYWGGGIPWLSSGETGNAFITTTEKSITQQGVENSSTRYVRQGGTVVASAGQGKTRGQTSMILLGCYINQSTIALTANNSLISDSFLYFDLSRRYDQFRQISDGSSRGSLTTKLLTELSVLLPPIELVRRFDSLASAIIKSIEVDLKRNHRLRAIRDLLLPKLISGELDVERLDINTGTPETASASLPSVEK